MRHPCSSASRDDVVHRVGERGFSIVELLLVFAIVGIAMIPLAGVQFGSSRQITDAERMTEATQIALSSIERVKMAGFNAAALGDTLSEPPFTAVTTVVPDSANPFLEEIRVRVTWDQRGAEREVVMAVKQSAR